MLLLIFKLSSLCLDFIQQIFTEHTHCTSGTVLDSRINAEWDTSSHLWGEEIDSPLGWVNCKWMWLVLMSKEVMCYGPMLTSALFTTARTWKQPKWPSPEEWIKEDVVHIYNGLLLLSHIKEWNWIICRDVDGPRLCHTQWSKSRTEKRITYINGYMWNLENGIDNLFCKAEIET